MREIDRGVEGEMIKRKEAIGEHVALKGMSERGVI